jgi:phosphoribosylglycinamide formyltransferase-1
VLAAEHRLYPWALAMVARGQARMDGGRTVFAGSGEAESNAILFSPSPSAPVRAQDTDLEYLARFTP